VSWHFDVVNLTIPSSRKPARVLCGLQSTHGISAGSPTHPSIFQPSDSDTQARPSAVAHRTQERTKFPFAFVSLRLDLCLDVALGIGESDSSSITPGSPPLRAFTATAFVSVELKTMRR